MTIVPLNSIPHEATVRYFARQGIGIQLTDGKPEALVPPDLDPAQVASDIEAHDPLPDVRAEKIAKLSEQCRNSIVAGFKSAALGSDHWYDGDIEDQINIMGAAAAGMDLPFRCYPIDANGNKIAPKTFILHTAAQLQQVYQDGVAFKLAQLEKLESLRAQVEAATTVAEVEAIQW